MDGFVFSLVPTRGFQSKEGSRNSLSFELEAQRGSEDSADYYEYHSIYQWEPGFVPTLEEVRRRRDTWLEAKTYADVITTKLKEDNSDTQS